MSLPTKSPRPFRHNPYVILALVAFGVFIAADDLTVVSTMLPQMIFDFGIPVPSGLDDAAWIVSAYLIAYLVTMPFMGRVSDIYGRRFVYVASLLLFAVGSLFVPLVSTLSLLIAARAIQALGGGAIVPVAMAVVGDVFPANRRAFAIGLLGAIDTAGWIWGPMYGALLVRYGPVVGSWLAGLSPLLSPVAGWGWQWQFYINVPVSLLAALLAGWALGGLRSPQANRSLDWAGAALLTAALVAVNVGLSKSGGQAAVAPTFDFSRAEPSGLGRTLPWFAGGLLALGAFVWAEGRTAHPIIDLRMFRLRNFTLACLVNFTVGFVLIVAMVDVPLFVNSVLAQGGSLDELLRSAALESGQVLTALTVSMAVASVIGGWLCGRFGYRLPAVAGLLMTAAAFALMSTWGPDESRWRMALHLALGGFGFGLVTSPVGTATIDAVSPDLRGVASGLVLILRLMGMSVGLSALTAWGLHQFEVLSLPYSITELGQFIVSITARVLDEMFLAAAVVTLLGVGLALGLRRRAASIEEGG
jgi:EmrB/QacA subfamily drug resistance transporter